MIRRHDRLAQTLEGVSTFLDLGHYFRLGALLSCERVLRTALPVLSDLMRITGSSFVPRRTTVPPLGPLTVDRPAPLTLVTVPKVRTPWYIQLTRWPLAGVVLTSSYPSS